MFENFDPRNDDDLKRLFSYLEKDKFNSLSFSDQNSVIDTLISISNKDCGDSSVKTIGMMKGSNGFTNFDLQSIIDKMGYEPFREMMREAISKGGLTTSSINASEVTDLVEKMKNGTLTEKEKEALDAIMSHEHLHCNDQEDVQFSTYSIVHLYTNLLDQSIGDKEVTLLRDAEPFINAAYIALLASLISKPDNAIGKMFDKHGFEKVQMSIIDLTVKFSNMIIDYSKDNNIAPERTLIALANVIKILAGPLDTSLDAYPDDMLEEVLSHVLAVVYDIDPASSVDELRKGSKDNNENNDSTNKSANADKKESQSDKDIRKLLLDD